MSQQGELFLLELESCLHQAQASEELLLKWADHARVPNVPLEESFREIGENAKEAFTLIETCQDQYKILESQSRDSAQKMMLLRQVDDIHEKFHSVFESVFECLRIRYDWETIMSTKGDIIVDFFIMYVETVFPRIALHWPPGRSRDLLEYLQLDTLFDNEQINDDHILRLYEAVLSQKSRGIAIVDRTWSNLLSKVYSHYDKYHKPYLRRESGNASSNPRLHRCPKEFDWEFHFNNRYFRGIHVLGIFPGDENGLPYGGTDRSREVADLWEWTTWVHCHRDLAAANTEYTVLSNSKLPAMKEVEAVFNLYEKVRISFLRTSNSTMTGSSYVVSS